MNFIFVGPPGAGKGTIAARVAQELSVPHISTGEIFRENIRGRTELGVKIKELLDRGELVPDHLTIELVKERLTHPDVQSGWILDGFPRTRAQAEALDEFVHIDLIFHLEVDDETVVGRLGGRRVHPASGRTYHVVHNPPKQEGIDDVSGEPLVKRDDDERDAIKHRLEVYRQQTAPVVEYYAAKDRLTQVDASRQMETVLAEVLDLIATRK